MNIIEQIRKISQTYDIKPAKSKGQNFLINPEVIKKIVAGAEVNLQDTILEVGPGLGILTEELIKKAGKIISVELDEKLLAFLRVKFVGVSNLELLKSDILKVPDQQLPKTEYKVVANIPYNITSILIKKFLTSTRKPSTMTLLIQKEVAQRICAKPGQMSLLAVSVQLYGQPQIIDYVTKENFWPKPAVDSAIIHISKIKNQSEINKDLAEIGENEYWQLVRIGFSAKRKQLQHNLAAGFKIKPNQAKEWIIQAGFDSKIRAQNLSVQGWIALAKIKKNHLK